jgi:hypothetical protein
MKTDCGRIAFYPLTIVFNLRFNFQPFNRRKNCKIKFWSIEILIELICGKQKDKAKHRSDKFLLDKTDIFVKRKRCCLT